jgi:hypothetical protein
LAHIWVADLAQVKQNGTKSWRFGREKHEEVEAESSGLLQRG